MASSVTLGWSVPALVQEGEAERAAPHSAPKSGAGGELALHGPPTLWGQRPTRLSWEGAWQWCLLRTRCLPSPCPRDTVPQTPDCCVL